MPKDWKFKLFEISHMSEPNNPPNETKQANPKEVAFYQEAVGAWFQTNLEHDKTKVTLASGAIGLLITLFCFCSEKHATWTTFVCMIVSILFFLATIIVSEVIFQKNARLIENIINGKENPSIGHFDKFSWITFVLGIVFALVYICNVAYHVLPPFTKQTLTEETKQTQNLCVLEAPSIEQSVWVKKEIEDALNKHIPIYYEPLCTKNDDNAPKNVLFIKQQLAEEEMADNQTKTTHHDSFEGLSKIQVQTRPTNAGASFNNLKNIQPSNSNTNNKK